MLTYSLNVTAAYLSYSYLVNIFFVFLYVVFKVEKEKIKVKEARKERRVASASSSAASSVDVVSAGSEKNARNKPKFGSKRETNNTKKPSTARRDSSRSNTKLDDGNDSDSDNDNDGMQMSSRTNDVNKTAVFEDDFTTSMFGAGVVISVSDGVCLD